MDAASLGIGSVAAITVICLLVGYIVKLTPWDNNKLIPVVCGAAGMVLGIACLYAGVPEFPATDPITAAAVGIVSGLAATGLNQVYRQMAGKK